MCDVECVDERRSGAIDSDSGPAETPGGALGPMSGPNASIGPPNMLHMQNDTVGQRGGLGDERVLGKGGGLRSATETIPESLAQPVLCLDILNLLPAE